MAESFKDKIRSINFGSGARRAPKTRVDVHDHGTVEVTEHWDDRVDVNVKPDTLRMSLSQKES